jgi:hypothetical protein
MRKKRDLFVELTEGLTPWLISVPASGSEQGWRLTSALTTVREGRREFARHLRALAVDANATERGVRGRLDC